MPLPTLRTVTDTILIVAALAVTAIAGQLYYQGAARIPAEPKIVAPQERIVLRDVDFGQSQRTLLLVLSSRCVFCEKSMPFYSRLVASKGKHSRIVVVGGEDEEILKNYLSEHEIAVDGVRKVTAYETPSQVTPTAILVSADGVVNKVWRGQLPPQVENEVIQLMSQE